METAARNAAYEDENGNGVYVGLPVFAFGG